MQGRSPKVEEEEEEERGGRAGLAGVSFKNKGRSVARLCVRGDHEDKNPNAEPKKC